MSARDYSQDFWQIQIQAGHKLELLTRFNSWQESSDFATLTPPWQVEPAAAEAPEQLVWH